MKFGDFPNLCLLASIWNFRCAPIPAIFVSYPNTKFKKFQKAYNTICSVPPFLIFIVEWA